MHRIIAQLVSFKADVRLKDQAKGFLRIVLRCASEIAYTYTYVCLQYTGGGGETIVMDIIHIVRNSISLIERIPISRILNSPPGIHDDRYMARRICHCKSGGAISPVNLSVCGKTGGTDPVTVVEQIHARHIRERDLRDYYGKYNSSCRKKILSREGLLFQIAIYMPLI